MWLTFTPRNAVQVALEYDGDRELRLVCTDPDEAVMYEHDKTGRARWGGDYCGAFG